MTRQEQLPYLTRLLLVMARQPWGCDISEQGLDLTPADLIGLANRLVAEGLATQNDPRFTYYLAITPKGQQIAEYPGSYEGVAQEQARQSAEQLRNAFQQEGRAWRNTWLTTAATIVSALAAVAAIWVSISANNSQGKADAQLEALTKRIQALEAAQQHQRHQGQ